MHAQPVSRPPLTNPHHGPRTPACAHLAGFRATMHNINPSIPLYWMPLASDWLRGRDDARKALAERYGDHR